MESIEIIGFKPNSDLNLKMTLYEMSVSAGYPIPVDSGIEKEVDLNEFLVEHPAATFFAKVNGLDMLNAGIRDGDILVVDSAVEPSDGKIVLAEMNNGLTVKIYREHDGEYFLESGKSQFLPLSIGEIQFNIIGTVTKIIHSL
ncbi:MAG: LexA family transcriptional regulator [Candidatus Kapabacteria bacterium]|nr:LexA family transcriptional regulator [Ignavibacteriota bacterium]MCW5885000.1 LexA family transcriptional regulator [Candidatus Kapabacteria bacterium]